MPKKSPHIALPKTKASFGWLFVIIWPVITAIVINNSPLSSVIGQLEDIASAWVVAIIVLAPITAVLLPLLYRIDSNDRRETPIPTWKRIIFSVAVTSILLVMLGYFYLIVSFAFASNFD